MPRRGTQIPSPGRRTTGRAVRQCTSPITSQSGVGPMAVNVKKVALFLGLTFALTYLLAIVYFQAGGTVDPTGILIVGVLYMFVPAVCAVIVQSSVRTGFGPVYPFSTDASRPDSTSAGLFPHRFLRKTV